MSAAKPLKSLYSSAAPRLNSATIRLEAAKKTQSIQELFAWTFFLTKQLLRASCKPQSIYIELWSLLKKIHNHTTIHLGRETINSDD